MAWRNTNPSDYAPKSNAIGDALTGFASVYVPAKIAKDKREAEIAYEKEKADAKSAKDAADKAAAKDAQDKKDAKVVNAILRNMDLTPNQVTSEIKIGILEDVQALGVSSAMDIYNDPAKKFTEEYAYGKTTGNTNQVAAPAQYLIGTDANATISKGNSETNTMLSEASTDLSFNVDEADKEEEKDVDTQTDLAFPEVETKEVKKYQSVAITTKEIVDLGEAGRIAALNDPTVSAENKKRITNWQTANQSILDAEAEKIPYGDITATNYIQIAAGFRR